MSQQVLCNDVFTATPITLGEFCDANGIEEPGGIMRTKGYVIDVDGSLNQGIVRFPVKHKPYFIPENHIEEHYVKFKMYHSNMGKFLPVNDFSWAMLQVKTGYKVRRDSWPEGGHIVASMGKSSHFAYRGAGVKNSCLQKRTSDMSYLCYYADDPGGDLDGHQPGWLPSAGDLFADDWSIIPLEKED